MASYMPGRAAFGYRMKLNREQLLAYLALTAGLLAIGFSAIFIRRAEAPGTVASFYRMSIGLLVLSLPFLSRRRSLRSLPWT